MHRWSGVIPCALSLAMTLAIGALARPARGQAPEAGHARADYEQLIREALAEFTAGNFAEARALFERAHAERPSARTLRGLGITSFELKRYVEALHELEAALADSRTPLNDRQRAEVEALLLKVRRFVGKVTLQLTPTTASVFIDDRAVNGSELLLNLGIYRVSVRAPGYREARVKLVVDGGEERIERIALVRLDLSPAQVAAGLAPGAVDTEGRVMARTDARSGSVLTTWWFWTGVGAVVAGGTALALAVALGGDARPQPAYRGSAGSLDGP